MLSLTHQIEWNSNSGRAIPYMKSAYQIKKHWSFNSEIMKFTIDEKNI